MAARTTGTAAPRKRTPAKATTPRKGRPTPARDAGDLHRMSDDDLDALTVDQAPALTPAFDDNGDPIPVVVGQSGKKGAAQSHLFTVDGVDYFVPKPLPRLPLVAFLRSMRDARSDLEKDAAVMDLCFSTVGRAGVRALAESDETNEEDVARVFGIVQVLAMRQIAAMRAEFAAGNS